MTIYTLGYSGWTLDQVAAKVEELNAVLVDVRFVPRSRIPAWNSGVLSRRFGDRYIWLKELGNRNYKGTFDQIEIVDFPAGAAKLQNVTATGRNIILLCGCPDVDGCHRKVLAEQLVDACQAVEHLAAHVREKCSRPLGLFDA